MPLSIIQKCDDVNCPQCTCSACKCRVEKLTHWCDEDVCDSCIEDSFPMPANATNDFTPSSTIIDPKENR